MFFDVYNLNLETDELNLIFINNKFENFYIDDFYDIRFAQAYTDNGGLNIFKFFKKDNYYKFDLFLNLKPDDAITTYILDFPEDKDKVYFISTVDRDTSALYLLDVNTKEKKLLFENAKADIEDIIINPINKKLETVFFYYIKQNYVFFDEKFKKDFEIMEKLFPNAEILIQSRDLNNNLWVFEYHFDNFPAKFYLFDRRNKKLQFLFSKNSKLEKYTFNKMNGIIIKSRDGLDLVSYITYPQKSLPEDSKDNKNNQSEIKHHIKNKNKFNNNKQETEIELKNLIPKKPLPMVIFPHGGPIARHYWGYSKIHQWLSNRGYIVLDINFRGSSGFGKNFIKKGNGEWGGKMHDDIIDGVNWAIENKIADKNKIGIFGGSYAGYEVLVGLTFTPEVFAVGIDIVGISNLITDYLTMPEYWKTYKSRFKLMLGEDPEKKEDLKKLKKKSPFYFVKNIVKPLLISHGLNDPRVKKNESDQIVNEMKKNGIPVTYLVFPDEGHGNKKPENNFALYAIAEYFLKKNLDGRFENISDDFKGSSIEVHTGKELLPFEVN